MSLQRCKTLHAKRCKVTNSLREVGRTLSHMYGRLYGTTEGRNVVLNPVPSQWQVSLFQNYVQDWTVRMHPVRYVSVTIGIHTMK